MRGEMNSAGMRFYFSRKSHFGVQSAHHLCSHKLSRNETQTGMNFISVILTEMDFPTGMRFHVKKKYPKRNE